MQEERTREEQMRASRIQTKQLQASPATYANAHRTSNPRSSDPTRFPQALPVLDGTRLCLELALGEGALDVQRVTDILRRDPVAVLRLFFLATDTGVGLRQAPDRLEDCLACVGRHDLLQAFSHFAPRSGREQAICFAFAQHAFAIACSTRAVAGALALHGEHAFLVGLLHDIGSLQEQLAEAPVAPVRQAAAALAGRYRLPPFLCRALGEVHGEEDASLWTAAVRAAHDLVGDSGGHLVRDSGGLSIA